VAVGVGGSSPCPWQLGALSPAHSRASIPLAPCHNVVTYRNYY